VQTREEGVIRKVDAEMGGVRFDLHVVQDGPYELCDLGLEYEV
jgi:hypothetical protein